MMSTLHTVNRSPLESGALEACLRMARDGAGVLFIEDGVYAAVSGAGTEARVRGAIVRLRVFALGPDLAARGLDAARVIEGITVVDYGGFVDLAVEHRVVQAWI